jgi:hypothetical protein
MPEDSNIYARRTMCVYRISFSEFGRPSEILDPEVLKGASVYDLFDEFLEGLENDIFETSTPGRFVSIVGVEHVDSGSLVHLRSGLAGESGRLVDTVTADVEYSFGGTSAPMVDSRVFLTTRDGFGFAMLCVEHVLHGVGDTVILREFQKFFSDSRLGITMKYEALTEAEAIESFISVESVEVRSYLSSPEIESPLVSEGDYVSTILRHKRGRPLSTDVFMRARGNRKGVSSLFGVTMDPAVSASLDADSSKVFVTMKDRNRSNKTFEINESVEMPVRQILNDSGTPPLADATFVNLCVERCGLVSDRTGRIG